MIGVWSSDVTSNAFDYNQSGALIRAPFRSLRVVADSLMAERELMVLLAGSDGSGRSEGNAGHVEVLWVW